MHSNISLVCPSPIYIVCQHVESIILVKLHTSYFWGNTVSWPRQQKMPDTSEISMSSS